MNRYIDRDFLERRIHETMDMQDLYLPVHFMQLMDEQDTVDAVEVVRCKDCKYYRESKPFSVLITECTYSDCSIWTEPNGYCHRAKKRRVE